MKEFIQKRDEMLLKKDVNELRKFVDEYSKWYPLLTYKAIMDADEEYLEEVLHFMIVYDTNLQLEMRNESKEWLVEHGCMVEVDE